MYSQESIIDLKVVLSAHHRGHFEFKACPISESQVPDENCFNAHRLEFISDELYNAPKDDNFPGRAYIAPPSMGTYDNSGVYGMSFHFKYKLPPGISGKVLLQWNYYTANSCVYDGYGSYQFPDESWNSSNLGICTDIPPDGNGVPEMFWNCAEVFVDGDTEAGNPTSTPTFSPSVAPTVHVPTSDVTTEPTQSPSRNEPPAPTPGSSCSNNFSGLVAVDNCSGFQHCQEGSVIGGKIDCPSGLLFHERIQACDWPYNVNCGTRRYLRKEGNFV
mmetsp:Transcript_28390/g.32560  ORF Transcript_28390/g.32560 Transcript_28390/m.32560 type:complete len:274 (+) Transcript_28390:502-1323(+)